MVFSGRQLDVPHSNSPAASLEDHPLSPGGNESASSYFEGALGSEPATTSYGVSHVERPPLSPRDTARPLPTQLDARPPLFQGLSDLPEASHASKDAVLVLRKAPHKLDPNEVEQKLLALRGSRDEATKTTTSRSRSPSISAAALDRMLPVDLVVSLLTSLSEDLERSQLDLAKSHRTRTAQIEALKEIIRRDVMGVSEATVERALLRASANVEEAPTRQAEQSPHRWQLRLRETAPRQSKASVAKDDANDPDQVSLNHDLEEAMSETNVVLDTSDGKADSDRASLQSHGDQRPRQASLSARLLVGRGSTRPASPTPVKKGNKEGATPDAKASSTLDASKRSRSDSAVSAAESSKSSSSSKAGTPHRASPHGLSGWASGLLGWGGKRTAPMSAEGEEGSDVEETLHSGVTAASTSMTRSSSVSSMASTSHLTSTTDVTTYGPAPSSTEAIAADDALATPSASSKAPHAAVNAVLSKRAAGAATLSSTHAHVSSAVSSPMAPSFSAGSLTGSLPVTHPTHYTAVVGAAQKWVAAGAKTDINEGLLRKPRSVSPAVRKGTLQLLGGLSKSTVAETDEASLDDAGNDSLVASGMSRAASSSSLAPSHSSAKQDGYLKSAKGQLGRALGLGTTAHRPKAKRAEPSLTLPSLVGDRQTTIFSSLPIAPAVQNTVSTGPAVMELSTIVKADDKPPTFNDYQADRENGDVFFDRYGFALDMKSGMRSLREMKERVRQRATTRDPEAVEQAVKQAMGPSPTVTPSLFDTKTLEGDAVAEAPKSVKRLAAQLAEINETQERVQRDGWDAFFKKRHTKIGHVSSAKIAHHTALGSALAGDSITSGDESLWSENRIGIARLGRGDKDDWRTFKNLVRSGIPIAYRPAVWAEMSGAHELREPGYYQELVQKHEADPGSPCLKQIEADVGRTFGTNSALSLSQLHRTFERVRTVFFGGDGPGIPKLRRVLAAFSWHCPDIGYCQGMNMVAGTLLLTFAAEEDAFWMLTAIIERMLPSDYYTPTLLVSRADQRVLRDLCAKTMPDMQAFFDKQGMELEVVTFGWFLSLYSNVMPIQTLLRVWDLLFCDGVVVLFRVALAMIRMHQDEIYACDSATSIYVFLRNVPMQLVQADRLIKTACSDFRSVKTAHVIALREKHVQAMLAQEAPPS